MYAYSKQINVLDLMGATNRGQRRNFRMMGGKQQQQQQQQQQYRRIIVVEVVVAVMGRLHHHTCWEALVVKCW